MGDAVQRAALRGLVAGRLLAGMSPNAFSVIGTVGLCEGGRILGALLSSDDYGSSVERTAKLHPLWQALCRGRAASVRLPGQAAVSVPLGAQGSASAGARCLPRLLLALSRFRRMSLFRLPRRTLALCGRGVLPRTGRSEQHIMAARWQCFPWLGASANSERSTTWLTASASTAGAGGVRRGWDREVGPAGAVRTRSRAKVA
jgi:hypothetical protein